MKTDGATSAPTPAFRAEAKWEHFRRMSRPDEPGGGRGVGEGVESLADDAPVLLGLIARSGELRWCNRQWMEFTGASLGDLADSGWLQYIDEDDRDRLLDVLAGSAPFELDL